ncbi:MAG: lipid-A-disaccharide synthase [Longimicrobiales bacterium]
MTAPRILLSAGEPSGDLHGAAVARALLVRWPDARLYGLGGPLMEAEGVALVAHVDELAVMGLAEVASRLPFFVRLLRAMKRQLRNDPPDLVIPIDYPGFNLRLAKAARACGVPVLYYIAPQVWAWHRSRISELARNTARLAVILPFEEALFREAGAQVRFVGHPLLDSEPVTVSREDFARALGLDPARPILALFPGSRVQEIARHLVPFSAAAARVVESRPDVQPVVAAGSAIPDDAFGATPWPRTGLSWDLLRHASAALVKSGTSTLQAALAGTPMVVSYRMHPLTFAVARRVVRVDHVALANLVAGDRVVPELLQTDATPASLADALLPLLAERSPERARAIEGLSRVRTALAATDGEGSAAERVAALAGELLGRGS